MAHILLVDDDHDIRELGRALLTQARHSVTTADGAARALHILRNPDLNLAPIELVLSDVNMPEMSGFDLVKEIRADLKLQNLSVVFLTARRERSDVEQAVQLGVRDYIVKPLDPMLFLQKIKDLVVENSTQDFATASMRETARGSTEIEIVALSEIGLNIRSSHPYKPGSRIWLDTDLFTRIGILSPDLRVLSSQNVSPNSFETRVTFFGLPESVLSKIRAWVQKEVVKNAHSAS